MMIQPEINKTFSSEFIARFVLDNDKDGLFKSARLNKEEFINAVSRMNKENQVIAFNNNGILSGVLGWCFTTEERKHELGKQVWRLPDNITDGDILYLSFIATIGNCDVLAVKKLFKDIGVTKRINYRRGFTKNGWYQRAVIKGD